MRSTINNRYAAVANVIGTDYDGLYRRDTSAIEEVFRPDALIRVGGRWRIISKLFRYEPHEQTRMGVGE